MTKLSSFQFKKKMKSNINQSGLGGGESCILRLLAYAHQKFQITIINELEDFVFHICILPINIFVIAIDLEIS